MEAFGQNLEFGAELPLPGRIAVALDELQSSATRIRMNFQLLGGYTGVRLHYVITDQLHLTLPDIHLGNYAACMKCFGSVMMNDYFAHYINIEVNLPPGHYGLWTVGDGRQDMFTKQLILTVPYGLYWNIGRNRFAEHKRKIYKNLENKFNIIF